MCKTNSEHGRGEKLQKTAPGSQGKGLKLTERWFQKERM